MYLQEAKLILQQFVSETNENGGEVYNKLYDYLKKTKQSVSAGDNLTLKSGNKIIDDPSSASNYNYNPNDKVYYTKSHDKMNKQTSDGYKAQNDRINALPPDQRSKALLFRQKINDSAAKNKSVLKNYELKKDMENLKAPNRLD